MPATVEPTPDGGLRITDGQGTTHHYNRAQARSLVTAVRRGDFDFLVALEQLTPWIPVGDEEGPMHIRLTERDEEE